MYSYIRGQLVHVSTDHIVVENNGIGYQIYVPITNGTPFPGEGEEVIIYTHFSANENGVTLFGFFSEEDKKMFLQMITVSGIGPKGAISILSTLSTRDIIFAILNDDDKAISRAPGIGPKTARRMIIDLKDKLDISEDTLLDMPNEAIVHTANVESGPINDAIAALTALGYPYGDASRAVKGIQGAGDLDVETLLSLALKEL